MAFSHGPALLSFTDSRNLKASIDGGPELRPCARKVAGLTVDTLADVEAAKDTDVSIVKTVRSPYMVTKVRL